MSRKLNIFDNYFDSNIALLKLAGYWIYDKSASPWKRNLQWSYNLFWSIYLFGIYEPCEILFMAFASSNLDLFLRGLRDLGNHIASIYKTFNYHYSRKDILNLIDILQNYECRYEDHKDFNPTQIRDKHKQEAVKWTKRFWYFVNAICLTMFVSGLFVFIFQGAAQYVIEDDERVYRQKQPVNILSPFGNKTRTQFLLTFFFTIIALTFYAWMIVALDSLFITLMSCVSAHLEILQGAFKTLRPRCLKRRGFSPTLEVLHDCEVVEHEISLEMDKCVKHLQTIFDVSAKLEAIYNGQTLFQTFVSLGEMCFSLYLLSEEIDENTGNEITYLFAVSFELLMYCWFGNSITEASIKLSYSLYDGDWFPTTTAFKKQMIFTLTRLTRPIYVTIGKITPLTFTTFLTMVRGAYSFFTFLKQRDGIRH